MVEDHVLTLAKPGVESLPPGEHRLALVSLRLEIERVLLIITLHRMEPDRLPPIVKDQRGVFAGAARPRLLLRGDKDVTWGLAGRVRVHLDGGRAEIWTRTEGPRFLPPRG